MLTKGIFLAAFVALSANFAMAVPITPGEIAVRATNNADSDHGYDKRPNTNSDYRYDKRAVADSDYDYYKWSPSNADSDYGYDQRSPSNADSYYG